MIEWNKHSLLDLRELNKEEIEMVLETAKSLKEVSLREVKKVPALRGKTVVLLFFESSTRTRTSFELAAKRLSADTINIAVNNSAMSKGESVLDTARNLEAMNVDMIVVRHACAGVPNLLAQNLKTSIVNAGDGCREHPTQALLDLFTIKEKLGRIEGLKVGIVGDILHSRVARSNIMGFTKLGAEVTVCGPSTLMPPGIESTGVKVTYNVLELIEQCDVLMVLRIQQERQRDKYLPSIREYARMFGINKEKLRHAKKDILIMHPGPTNRGVELSAEVADGEYSVILDQVANGLAIRMAVLYLLLGTHGKAPAGE
ncbi:MAG TPA: aspartate carbamoyltransferase [Candidatus Omnitrophica bacterium]|nr:MAG: aspartate carbamoyltransferase [Omnitrophica WOR_2 bacterium GWA2_45_18]HBR14082.1 aspartate carbamoyltransferase [Candidatus Omnitrophota bacterium]